MTILSSFLDTYGQLGYFANSPIFPSLCSHLCKKEIRSNNHLRSHCAMHGVTANVQSGDRPAAPLPPLCLSLNIKHGEKQMFVMGTY